LLGRNCDGSARSVKLSLEVLFVPGANVNPGVRLVDNPRYPEIAADFHGSFSIWKSLSCDVLLGVHATGLGSGCFRGLK